MVPLDPEDPLEPRLETLPEVPLEPLPAEEEASDPLLAPVGPPAERAPVDADALEEPPLPDEPFPLVVEPFTVDAVPEDLPVEVPPEPVDLPLAPDLPELVAFPLLAPAEEALDRPRLPPAAAVLDLAPVEALAATEAERVDDDVEALVAPLDDSVPPELAPVAVPVVEVEAALAVVAEVEVAEAEAAVEVEAAAAVEPRVEAPPAGGGLPQPTPSPTSKAGRMTQAAIGDLDLVAPALGVLRIRCRPPHRAQPTLAAPLLQRAAFTTGYSRQGGWCPRSCGKLKWRILPVG